MYNRTEQLKNEYQTWTQTDTPPSQNLRFSQLEKYLCPKR
uniref:Uncharacterized protein n=1 Tax=Anguilla anguilla TaxID=7936 RepID=A0A0E9UVC1_ANGAN